VAITNTRIIRVENHKVFFRYKKPKSNRWRTMALSVMQFIRRFLQHVLPTGFMKVRYYGFMGAKPKVNRKQVRSLIELTFGFETEDQKPKTAKPIGPVCPECGAHLILRYVLTHLFGPVRGTG
jgi:hypothetical protein